MKYAVIIEHTGSNYSAYVPDLPGCVAAAADLEDLRQLIREAIAFHLEGLRAANLPIPKPSLVDVVDAV